MDRYTKTVLTVIAGCLLVLVGNQIDFPSKAYAAQEDGKMLETYGSGPNAWYFDGTHLYFCNYLSGCKKHM